MKKQKQKTKKEDLQKYVLSDQVNKTFVWSRLVTMPSLELMKNIHKTLWNAKKTKLNKKLKQELLNIDKLFFQILYLLHYYVTIGKDEKVMKQYTVHTAVTLLTEIINQFAIDDSNHADRVFDSYTKMLQLEEQLEDVRKQLQDVSNSTAADLIEPINLALEKMSKYLENQFVVLDRVFSAVYLKYNECTQLIDGHNSTENPKLQHIYDIITAFLENMRTLREEYPEHNFARLLIEKREHADTDVFTTPEKLSAKNNTFTEDLGCIPDCTPKRITDEVKKSAKYIKLINNKHKMSTSPILAKTILSPESTLSIVQDLDDAFSSKIIFGCMIDPQQSVSPLFGENNGEENTIDDEGIDTSSSNNSSSSSESDDDESKSPFFVRQPKKTSRSLFA